MTLRNIQIGQRFKFSNGKKTYTMYDKGQRNGKPIVYYYDTYGKEFYSFSLNYAVQLLN